MENFEPKPEPEVTDEFLTVYLSLSNINRFLMLASLTDIHVEEKNIKRALWRVVNDYWSEE